jgi:hypothetical protein
MAPKAKTKTSSLRVFSAKPKKKRKGIHAKTKMSKNKSSKSYYKINIGQG